MTPNLNLLPVDAKARLARERQWQLTLQQGCIVLGALVVCAAITGGLLWVFNRQLASVRTQTTAIHPSSARLPIGTLTQTLQTEIALLKPISQEPTPLVSTTDTIQRAIPLGIHLRVFEIDLSTRQVLLEGVADTRAAFLEFRTAMENLEVLAAVESPRSNLALREAIPFTLRASLTPLP